MTNNKIIQSPILDIETLKCPKCGVIWHSKGYYNYDEGGWRYEEEYCPLGCCTRILKLPLQGKVIPRVN